MAFLWATLATCSLAQHLTPKFNWKLTFEAESPGALDLHHDSLVPPDLVQLELRLFGKVQDCSIPATATLNSKLSITITFLIIFLISLSKVPGCRTNPLGLLPPGPVHGLQVETAELRAHCEPHLVHGCHHLEQSGL